MIVTLLKMLAIVPILALFHARGARASFEDAVFPRAPVRGTIEDAAAILLIRDGAALVPRVAPTACFSALEFIDFCSSVSPGFVSMDSSSQAPCLCYSSTVWMPGVFDGYVSTCASYAKTSSPEDYSAISALQGFCSDVGNVKGNTAVVTTPILSPTTTEPAPSAVTTPPITSAPVPTPVGTAIEDNTACVTASSLLSSCFSASKGFTALPTKSQANCLCYRGSSWSPSFFDNGIQACANYAKTADPTDYSVFAALTDFCSDAGDVRAADPTPAPTPDSPHVGELTTTTTIPPPSAEPTNAPVGGVTNTIPGSPPGDTVTVIAAPTQLSGSQPSMQWSDILLGMISMVITAAFFHS